MSKRRTFSKEIKLSILEEVKINGIEKIDFIASENSELFIL